MGDSEISDSAKIRNPQLFSSTSLVKHLPRVRGKALSLCAALYLKGIVFEPFRSEIWHKDCGRFRLLCNLAGKGKGQVVSIKPLFPSNSQPHF